jgi:protein-tyrosine phosphatase
MSIDRIGDGLHISSIRSVQSHDTGQYDVVVSVCQDTCRQNISDDTPYRHFPLADDEHSEENWGGSAEYDLFEDAAMHVVGLLLDEAVDDILVHCHVGKNRSAAICAAALGAYHDSSYERALDAVRDARPMVNPNELMRSHATQFIGEFEQP